MKLLLIKLSDGEKALLMATAKKYNTTMSDLIREFISGLSNLKKRK
jgi:hypothetical protein